MPDDPEEAKEQIRNHSSHFWINAGLVRVRTGMAIMDLSVFFQVQQEMVVHAANCLICFSCRTLGMKVERWVYDRFGRPDIDIVHPVLTDLDEPLGVDWNRLGVEGDNSDDNISKVPKYFFPWRVRSQCAVSLFFPTE